MTNDRTSKSQTELKKNNNEHFVSIHLDKKRLGRSQGGAAVASGGFDARYRYCSTARPIKLVWKNDDSSSTAFLNILCS